MVDDADHDAGHDDGRVLVVELRQEFGADAVLTGDDAAPFLTDWRGVFCGTAVAVVRPSSTDEVAHVVERCARAGVAIVPQGGNTGLSGGATPLGERPGIVLSLTRMHRIERVDPAGSTLIAQAGCTIDAIQQAARAVERSFAPDWGARGTATLGGAVATDAGGINVLRYGNLRPHVLGIEVVLPDGRVWDGLRALRKDSSGYDLKQLFIGSEGTLGIVTRAVVALEPARPFERTALVAVSSPDAVLPLLGEARRAAGDSLIAFELVPRVGLERVTRRYGIAPPLPHATDDLVLIKLAAADPVVDALAALIADAAKSGLVTDAVVAASGEQEERLWRIRDELPVYRLFEHQAIALKNDTAIPVAHTMDFLRDVRELVEGHAPGALTYAFGHVGDGNLHVAVLPDDGDDPQPFLDARDDLREAIDALTFRFGGTLSAEHGIGRDLVARIGPQKPPIEWELMRLLKTAFDPSGLMNPGAMMPE